MADTLSVPQGEFTLRLHRHDDGQPLRAWDAADEYVLHHVAEHAVDGDRWLIANDAAGALTVALAGAVHRHLTLWSDSVISHRAARANLDRNEIQSGTAGAATVDHVASTDDPSGPIDVAIVKIPRTSALLEDQLRRLRPLLHASSVVIGAGMTKAVHTSTIETFERLIGPTPTTKARKKARLLLATVDPDIAPRPPSPPVTWDTDDGIVVTNLPNVFSRQALDRGTRLLLTALPSLEPGSVVVDLGCGNGVVAATLARRNPGIAVICCDESYQAVASARATVGSASEPPAGDPEPGDPETSDPAGIPAGVPTDAAFHVTDALDGIEVTADLIVINPPFHARGARTPAVALQMFEEAAALLAPDGELRVVANRHLDHHRTLRRWFGNVDVVASNPQFVVLAAKQPK